MSYTILTVYGIVVLKTNDKNLADKLSYKYTVVTEVKNEINKH